MSVNKITSAPTDNELIGKVNEIIDNLGGGGGSSTLSGLTDVAITSAANGQVLTYDSASSKWINANSGGTGVPVPTLVTDGDNTGLTVAGNTIYRFGTALTTLTLTSVETSDYESIIYFCTGSSITFIDNSNLKWGSGTAPSLEANTIYCISIRNRLAEIDNFGTSVSGDFFDTNITPGSGYVPEPDIITDDDNTGLAIAANTIYKFTNALTVLTLSSAATSDYESVIYFSTGSSITFTDNSSLKWSGGTAPSLEVNTIYCIAIRNGLAEIDSFGTTV